MNDSHLYYLHRSIHDLMIHESNILTIPTLFEYYCSLKLSIEYDKPFTVWKDISPLSKSNYDMHLTLRDKGVDCASSDFKQLVQVKHYGEHTSICRGTLSTFLSFRHFLHPTKRDGIKLLLARTGHSKLTEEIRRVVEWGDITDHTYDHNVFIEECQQIKNNFIEVKMKQEARPPLRPPQLEALKVIEQSDLEEMNCILSIPTGVGKTWIVLEYCRLKDCSILVFVPTLVLMDQWYNEAVLYGFDKKKVVRIGSSSKDGYDPKSTYSLVICVYNSVEKIKGKISSFKKIVIDEAHRIKRPHIYKDEDITIEEDNEDSESESEEEESDEEDDVVEEEKHLVVLKRMICSQTNILLMSATIDRIQGYLYYSYTIREAIERGDICDYQLRVPIYNNCPNDLNIAEYLIREAGCHCIVFCSSIKQADDFAILLNSLLPNCARSVHSQLVDSKRKLYIQEFEASQIRFLVNVEVLVEGFNCPIVSSCVFLHLPSSETFAIQAIGRCLRMYPGKEFANIFLPYNRDEDLVDVKRFITEIGKKDPNIRRARMDKVGGTYINLEIQREVKNEEDDVKEEDNMEIDSVVEFRFEAIFNSLGQMDNQGLERWMSKSEMYRDFILKNNHLPSTYRTDLEVKSLGAWGILQKQNYKKKHGSMRIDEIRTKWESILNEFPDLFTSLSIDDKWNLDHQKYRGFILKNNHLPSCYSTEPEVKRLGQWGFYNKQNYRKKIKSMLQEEKRTAWESMMQEFPDLFISEDEEWNQNHQRYRDFIMKNNRLPSSNSTDPEERRLSYWRWNANRKRNTQCGGDEEENTKFVKWESTRKEFPDLLLTNDEEWEQNHNAYVNYILKNNRLPHNRNDPYERRLQKWGDSQKRNYEKKIYSMKSIERRSKWESVTKEFSYLFLSMDEEWNRDLKIYRDFIVKNNRLPSMSSTADIDEKRLARWESHQKHNYKNNKKGMMNDMKLTNWESINKEFSSLFLSKDNMWELHLQSYVDFIMKNKRLPTYDHGKKTILKDPEEKRLGIWGHIQRQQYKQSIHRMKDVDRRIKWESTLEEINKYLK